MRLLSIFVLPLILLSCQKSEPADTPVVTLPPTLRDGITRISNDSLAFVLFAPKKQSVYLIGDFNNWQISDQYKMNKYGDRFWIKIGNLDPNREYICQYLIDNQIRIADPYAGKISDPVYDKDISSSVYPNLISYPAGKTTEIAMTVSTKQDNYNWSVQNFQADNNQKLNIYEILIRDFTEQRSIKGVQSKIQYLKTLGINAVELMPFNEFEGNDSWGYNPSFYFATDKAYGTKNDYKDFIDACHSAGIAVIMDMVLNHSYGQSPLVRMYQSGDKVSSDNPWYNVTSPNTSYSWGYDFNHESQYTKQFVDSVCAFWIKEFKIDGFRFDFTKGFTNTPGDGYAYDASRIAILERMTREIRNRKNNAIIIFEHLADNSEERELAEYGIMLWGNMNYSTNEATMGWGEEVSGSSLKGDLSPASYKQRGWNVPNLVAYMESHDEERIMYKNELYGKEITGYSVKNIPTGLKRSEAAAVILFSLPGPKMIWQFGELGYDYKLGSSMEDGRLDKKPIRWDYYDQPERKELYDVYTKMFTLRQTMEIFSTSDYSVDLRNNFKYIVLNNSGKSVVSMANFDTVNSAKTVEFGKAATWRDYFTGQEITTSGTGLLSITLAPGEYRLYFEK
jgi:glycosidase